MHKYGLNGLMRLDSIGANHDLNPDKVTGITPTECSCVSNACYAKNLRELRISHPSGLRHQKFRMGPFLDASDPKGSKRAMAEYHKNQCNQSKPPNTFTAMASYIAKKSVVNDMVNISNFYT
ncbi:hypothetical protein DdX_21880 [Ditylenchus destructor]|uniref:Uncharacterized protein n=1 Tax=Ditylenchus destructor TaxID=166010 RepID=A0AAD4QUV8_9BILA|nr:hypothetical protein DdX_21880 [Ditylenchus destructor]